MGHQQWFRAAVALALVAALSLGLVARGDDDSDDGGSAAATAATGGDSVMADAQSLVDRVTSGPVYATVDAPTEVAQLEDYGEWRGPTSAPKPKAGQAAAL
jgi:hypothetical protein